MPVARPESSDARVIAHIDMDCFYVQVEQRKQPDLRGVPTAVVQYNSWKGGGLIAVSYEARKYGVKRSMRGDEAKKVCPQIHLVQVPVARGKADLNLYRHAGSEVVSILSQRGRCERASIDEVYLDLTDAAQALLSESPPENVEVINKEVLESHVLGLTKNDKERGESVREWLHRSDADLRDKLLACGAIIVAELRMQVLKETEFTCSAGIAHNKMLAKLASAMNKPAQQTVVPFSSVQDLLASLPIKKMKQLGGKLGNSLQTDLGVNTVGDLLQFSEENLQDIYGVNTGTWLWNVARGISGDEVEGRLLPKSHGCGKTFPGPQALTTISTVEGWLNDLCEELSERIQSDLDQNKRVAHTLSLHARAYVATDLYSHKKFPSKSCPLRYGTAKIQEDAMKLFNSGLREFLSLHRIEAHGNRNNVWGVTALSVSASKILSTPPGTCSILRFFHEQEPSCSLIDHKAGETIEEFLTLPPSPSAYERCSGSDASEPLKGSTCQETTITCNKSSLAPCVRGADALNKVGSSILDYFHSHDPTSSSPGVIQDTETLSGSDFGLGQIDAQKENPINCVKLRLGRDEKNRGAMNDKGTRSILRFFRTDNPPYTSSKEVCEGIIRDKAPSSSSVTQSCSGINQVGLEGVRTDSWPGLNGKDRIREPWNFNVEDIDPSVIDELPREIQDEVRGWLRRPKRANIAKRGSSIAHYFSPAKKT